MPKELSKYKYKPRRKAEYSNAAIAALEEFRKGNQGKNGMPIDNVIAGGAKRGHGRGKASDAGPSKKVKQAAP
jgi:hypothetical protein